MHGSLRWRASWVLLLAHGRLCITQELDTSLEALKQLRGRVPLMTQGDIDGAMERLLGQVQKSGMLLRNTSTFEAGNTNLNALYGR